MIDTMSATEHRPAPPAHAVKILGIPWDDNSSFLRGCAEAPARIRDVMHGGATNMCAENGVDLGEDRRFGDAGDVEMGDAAADRIQSAVSELIDGGSRVIAVGGDHSITVPVLRAYGPRFDDLTIVQIDAHPDLYEAYGDNPMSHASPFARIMEEGLAARLVQIGIRTMNPHQRRQAEHFGVEVIDMHGFATGRRPVLSGPIYLTIDIDALDPAFAPGVSHHEPGGLTTRQVIELIQGLPAPIVGADIAELNPRRDHHDMTAMVAVKLLKEITVRMLESVE